MHVSYGLWHAQLVETWLAFHVPQDHWHRYDDEEEDVDGEERAERRKYGVEEKARRRDDGEEGHANLVGARGGGRGWCFRREGGDAVWVLVVEVLDCEERLESLGRP